MSTVGDKGSYHCNIPAPIFSMATVPAVTFHSAQCPFIKVHMPTGVRGCFPLHCSILCIHSYRILVIIIFLPDPQWHEPLLEEHTDEVCVSILLEIMEKDAPLHSSTTPCPRVELVPPCLTILRLLAEYSSTCRHRLATKYATYTLVTR